MELIKQNNLPIRLEDLAKFVLVGREKLTAVRAEIRAIDKLGLASEVTEQKKEEAQDLADALLDAEIQMGKLYKEVPIAKGNQYVQSNNGVTKQEEIKRNNHNKMYVSRIETLSDHADIVKQVKVEARKNNDLSTRTECLKRIKEFKRENVNLQKKSQPLPQDEFDLIYIDPPWRYDFAETDSRAIENKYPTMLIEELKEIELPCADNCVLFMWATAPKLVEALELMQSWGFEYKTNAIWDKEKIGMGYWFRGQHELLLVGTKGHYSPPIPENRISSVIREARTIHSKKPVKVYEALESMFKNAKKIEMFQRQSRQGWEGWGNESISQTA